MGLQLHLGLHQVRLDQDSCLLFIYISGWIISYGQSCHLYSPLIIQTSTSIILLPCQKGLYNVGLRKFSMLGVGPPGCIPNQIHRARGQAPPGRCADSVNQIL